MTICKLLIADDQEIMCYALKRLFDKIEDINICGVARNGNELVSLARELKPDVILTDMKMPGMNVVQATMALKKEFPSIKIIAFSSYDDDPYVIPMLEAGAYGYLLKSESTAEIPEAVRSVLKGMKYYSNSINIKLIKLIAENENIEGYGKVAEFNERELDVIQLVCKEFSSKEIGEQMSLSPRTIEGYKDSIMFKIGAKNSVGIVVYAIKHKLYEV
ncbi:MAG: response regulator transcription factor [Ferruginibacter sp.]